MVKSASSSRKRQSKLHPKPLREPSQRILRRRRRQQEVLRDGARKALENLGWAACSTQDILDAADVSRATLYNHFPSKDALIATLLDDVVKELLANPQRQAFVRPKAPISIRQSIAGGYGHMFSVVLRERRLLAALDSGIRLSDELSERWRALQQMLEQSVVVELGTANRYPGLLKPGINIPAVSTVLSTITDALLWTAARREDVDVPSICDVLCQIYWDTVYGRPNGPKDFLLHPNGSIEKVS